MLLETDCIKFPTKSNTPIMVILYFYFNKHLNTQKDRTFSVNVCWDQIFTKAKVTNFLHLLYNNLINTLITLFLLVWISTVKRYVLWKNLIISVQTILTQKCHLFIHIEHINRFFLLLKFLLNETILIFIWW